MQNNTDIAPRNPTNAFARECLAQALIRLMDRRELESINVSDICREAGFSRMAYYRNFSSKQDILIQYMKTLADDFRREAMKKYPDHSTRSYEIILFAFTYFKDYKVFAQRLINANLSSILQDGVNYYFEKYVTGSDKGSERRYAMYYYAGALYNLYTRWIIDDLKESPEFMANIVYDLLHQKK